jgi:hypothetical protein
MKFDKSSGILAINGCQQYEFTSTGPKGTISKVIQFEPTLNDTIVNLSFGNRREDGSIDDLARNNNKDSNKILDAIASVLIHFFEVHPDKWVFFAGNTPERTRLYRMAITHTFKELATGFEVMGVVSERGNYFDMPFEKGVDYPAFLVRPKKTS